MTTADVRLTSTYRVQLNASFRLADVLALVPYLARLGVSHLYASPMLAARPGSTHGYDVIDPTRLNPEFGTDGDLRALADALHDHGMGLLLDIVPNHMAATAANPYWDDVLRHGRGSPYASWFDIDWDTPSAELRGRVLVPILGAPLDDVLAHGELRIEGEGDDLRLRYYQHSFPIDPATIPETGDRARRDAPGSGESMPREAGVEPIMSIGGGPPAITRELLDRQHYRLAHWRRAAKEINYRRFFDVNDLVALRQEDPQVFDATHALVLDWVSQGLVDGLRIDHIDGLLDPLGYLERLRAEVARRRPDSGDEFPIVVEKILSPGESLRREWPIEGTTGYEFITDAEAIFVEPDGNQSIEAAYRRLLRIHRDEIDFLDVATRGKLLVLRGALFADVARLARSAASLPVRGEAGGRPSQRTTHARITEYLARLPVYRTYVDGRCEELDPQDRDLIARTIDRLRSRRALGEAAIDWLRRILLPGGLDAPGERDAWLRFVQRLQQTSGPATAKGIEDTALYRYYPLASRNEVGGEPDRDLSEAVERFHAANARRASEWPRSLLAGTTHDTKRSADVRARLSVLSEIPDEWLRAVARWRRMNRAARTPVRARLAPDDNLEYLFCQSVVALWPAAASREAGDHPRSDPALVERIGQYMLKAARESKARTSWIDPDADFEAALERFVAATLAEEAGAAFRADLSRFVARVAVAGLWTSLARHLVHLTAPGVPDLYQGEELWSFSLVDPDNRRPVDYTRRREMLDSLEAAATGLDPARAPLAASLAESVADGRIKLHVTRQALRARAEHAAAFERGTYTPLAAEGAAARHVFAFARRAHDQQGACAITVVPRFVLSLAGPDHPPVGADAWGDTTLALPAELPSSEWTCALTGRAVAPAAGTQRLRLADVFAALPVALLIQR